MRFTNMRHGIIGSIGLAACLSLWPIAAHADNLANARAAIKKGDLRVAQIELRNAIRNDPQNAEAHFWLARVSLELGDPVAAERSAMSARDRGYDPSQVVPVLSQAMLAQNKFEPLLELLKAGRKDEFDKYMAEGLDPATKNSLVFRMRPYGLTSYYDVYKAAMAYNLTDVAGKIECPMLITAPANEAFWPGQSQRLYDLLKGPKTLVPFSASDGADLHCEPAAAGLRDLRVFNWLDKTLG